MKFERPTISSALSLAVALALAPALLPTVRAQAPAAPGLDQQRFTQGQQAYQGQKYEEAIKIFESIEKDFPTSAYIAPGNLQIGVCHYFTGEYDQGIASLRKNLSSKNITPDILEDSQALIPQLLSAKAQKLPPGDPGRKAALDSAVKEFDVFVQKFPQSAEVEQANLGKARALYGLEKFEEAAATLRINTQKFSQSESALDTQYMLALVLATQANETKRKATVAGEDKSAEAAYDEAEKLLREIIAKRTDLAVMNDAQFQLGEVLAARGAYAEKGEKQDGVLYKSLDAYRNTFPKELVVQAQNARIKGFQDRMRDAGTKGQVAELRRFQNLIQREQAKLADLEQRADQTLAAKLKSAQIYLTLNNEQRPRMDEARVLLRFVEAFTEDPEQKKQILYFTLVTYAAQHVAAKAEELYAKWTAAHDKDPMGENLGLLLGAMYLDPDPKLNKPEKAIEYFKKQAAAFPKSKFTGQAVMQEGLALLQLKRYDDAAKAINTFLATKPDKELAAAAEFGLASVYKESGKPDQAIQTFRAVREKYAGTEQAEQASFWVGQMLIGKGDAKTALVEVKAFIAKFPKSELLPAALLSQGQMEKDLGQKDAAVKTFKELAAKYPEAEVAPFAYFQQAGLLQAEAKYPEVKAVMKEFIAKYPKSERVFGAMDYIAQIQIVEKQPQEAITTYEEYATRYPETPQAPTAILKASDQWRKSADTLGRYLALPAEKQAEWKKAYENSVAAAERVLEKYPESPEVALALQNLLAAQQALVMGKLRGDANVENYFNELAKKFADKPSTASKIKFTLAGYFTKKEPEKALKMMKEAYDPKLVYAPADLDLYAEALIDQKKFDEVLALAEKLKKDFPLPPNAEPSQLPRNLSDPPSMALFYEAKVLQLTQKEAEAQVKFEQLKKLYPWSPKLLEADFGIAVGNFARKDYAAALEKAGPVARATSGPPELRARAMMLIGQISEAKGDIDSAINNYVKTAFMFEGVPELAAEGLWRGAQLQEKKATGEVKQLPQATPAPAAKPDAASKAAK